MPDEKPQKTHAKRIRRIPRTPLIKRIIQVVGEPDTWQMLFVAVWAAFIVFQFIYNFHLVERVPRTTGTMNIWGLREGPPLLFLGPLLMGCLIAALPFAMTLVLLNATGDMRILPARIACSFALLVLGSGVVLGAFFVISLVLPASEDNVWVDLESQVVVKRETYLFPKPNSDNRLAFSDIDHITHIGGDQGVWLVKTDGEVFEICKGGRQFAQELAQLIEKPVWGADLGE